MKDCFVRVGGQKVVHDPVPGRDVEVAKDKVVVVDDSVAADERRVQPEDFGEHVTEVVFRHLAVIVREPPGSRCLDQVGKH